MIAPGDPLRSVLYYRMAKFGGGRMPHLGSEWPDEAGLSLVADWITSLGPKGTADVRPLPDDPAGVVPDSQLSLRAARMIARGQMPPAVRDRVLAAAAGPGGRLTHDLFDGFRPPDGRGRRLGPNPRPASILSLSGDADRGRALFFGEQSRCGSCHKVGEQGGAIGPDLSAVGKARSREELLDSMLNPSARIDPPHLTHLLRSADGRAVTGLVVRRDEKQVVARDAQGKDHAFDAADVEQLQPSRVSLMPDGLLSPMTAQEAADLLAFLVARK